MSEMSYTAVYSVALDRLVFGDPQFDDKGMVAHQGPVRKKARMQGNPECSDLLGIRMVMGVPSESVFVSDIKIGDSIGSTVETALYGKFASLSEGRSKEAVLVIGLSATVDTASDMQSMPTQKSYLIDFDLARKDGFYPPGYYFSDTVRHEDARAGLEMEKVHDLHALRVIIQHFFGDIAKDLEPTYDSISCLLDSPHAQIRATA
jgi:hypothetical protein